MCVRVEFDTRRQNPCAAVVRAETHQRKNTHALGKRVDDGFQELALLLVRDVPFLEPSFDVEFC